MDFISAHLTWFVKEEELSSNAALAAVFGGIHLNNLPFILGGILALICAFWLDRVLRKNKHIQLFHAFLEKGAFLNPFVVRVLVGISLIAASLQSNLLGPDFYLSFDDTENIIKSAIFLDLVRVEFWFGVILLIGILPQFVSALIFLFCVLVFVFFGTTGLVFNYLYFLGAMLYVLFEADRDAWTLQIHRLRNCFADLFKRVKLYSFSIFRVTAGVSLITVAIQEKLRNPSYGLVFLEQHNFNFLALNGFNFPNEYFILTAALVEILVGIFIIFHILPRFVAIVLLLLFITTFSLLGAPELIGHLVYIALVWVLLTTRKKAIDTKLL